MRYGLCMIVLISNQSFGFKFTVHGHSNITVSLTYLRGLEIAELKEADMPSL